MKQVVKTAVSLPAATFRRAETLRRAAGKGRSQLYAEAIEAYVKQLEVRELERRYEEGYRKHPETAAERAELKAIQDSQAGFGSPEAW